MGPIKKEIKKESKKKEAEHKDGHIIVVSLFQPMPFASYPTHMFSPNHLLLSSNPSKLEIEKKVK